MTITNKDIEKMKEVFATKDDFLGIRMDMKGLEEKIITKLDKVMGELEKAREDRVFAKAKDDELEKRLEKVVPT